MANYPYFLSLIFFISLPIPSHQTNLPTPTISAAPAVLPDPPVSPYTELSPDITPLLPSPGGATLSPAGPTIPSTRSPNPDSISEVGPDTAFAPSGPLQESSAVLVKGFKVEAFCGVLAFWLVMPFMM